MTIIQDLFTKTVLKNYHDISWITTGSGVEIISSIAFGIGCWLIFWTVFVTLKQSMFRKYYWEERECSINAHKTLFPFSTVAVIALTFTNFFLEMDLYNQREKFLESYRDFYGVQLPKLSTNC